MRKLLIREIAAPITRRLGTALAGFLAAQGIADATIQTIEVGFAAALAVGIDLALSHKNRKGA